MTPKQQRIAIAEACGWTLVSDSLYSWQNESLTHRIKWIAHKEMASQGVLPNYPEDLNDMHEAEKTLKLGMRSLYDANLGLIAERDYCFIWETNAAQRAEAFLRTLDLWKETK